MAHSDVAPTSFALCACFRLFIFRKSPPLFSVIFLLIKTTLSSIKYNKEKINLDRLKTVSQ